MVTNGPGGVCEEAPWGPWYEGMLSECLFQITIMPAIALFMILGGLFRLWQMRNFYANPTYTKVRMLEETVCWSVAFLSIATFAGRMITGRWYWFQVSADIRDLVSWALCALVISMEYNRSVPHSWIIRGWWVMQFVAGAFAMQSISGRAAHHTVDEEYGPEFDVIVYIARFVLITILCVSGLWCTQREQGIYKPLLEKKINYVLETAEEQREVHPELKATWFSRLCFLWASPLMALGYEKVLDMSDLWPLLARDKGDNLFGQLDHGWRKQIRGKKPSLAKACFRVFRTPFVMSGLFCFIYSAIQFVPPLILEQLLKFLEDDSKDDWFGYALAGGIFVSFTIQLFAGSWFMMVSVRLGMNIRAAIVTQIYRKSLRLSTASRSKSTTGEIVNLQAVDSNKLLMVVPFIHLGWTGILSIVASIVLLWQQVGVAVLSGLAVMIVLVPLNGIIMKKATGIQTVMMSHKDNRIRLVNEALNGIRIIKFFNWEKAFESKIGAVRLLEITALKHMQYLKAGIVFLFTTTSVWVTLATFATYTLQGNHLTPATAFTALALFNVMRMPLIQIPMVISGLVDSNVSLNRLVNFLLLDELHEDAVTHSDSARNQDTALAIENGTFAWNLGENSITTLSDINIEVKKGQLVAIVGQVGSGKTSLLSALLGDINKVEGRVSVTGSVAYVAQQSWMQNTSLRENITFGRPYVESKYNTCVRVCELEADLAMLPNRDLTEIGEKGINLSGGQKQRVSLARALYQDADIYLLDAPLSAVDAHVGAALFNNVIMGALAGKTRVLVTHHLDILDRIDNIFVVKSGKIVETGTFDNLLTSGLEFSELLKKYGRDADNPRSLKGETAGEEKSKTEDDTKEKKETTEKKAADDDKGNIMSMEDRKTGSVSWAVYLRYMAAVGGGVSVIILLVAFLVGGAVQIANDWWLSEWSTDEKEKHGTGYYLLIYALIGLAGGIIVFFRQLYLAKLSLAGGVNLHKDMLSRVVTAPMSFFDTTPVGRILNRFSKDMGSVDEMIPMSMGFLLSTAVGVISIAAVVSGVTPFFMVIGLPLVYFYYFVQQYYLNSSRELSRLESVTKSPVYAQFSETLNGLSTIRAFGSQEQFIKENDRKLDENSRAFYPYALAARWLAVRLEFVCAVVVAAAAAFTVLERGNISAGLAGVSLTYSLQLTSILNWLVRQSAEVEGHIVAVERIVEYAELPAEGPYEVPHKRPPHSWPSKGEISFRDLKMRYRENLDLVLKGITANVQPKEKVGIVGRTGSGKSSILLALFRMVEAADGEILIDDVNISQIGLSDLRSHLAIIPQDPTLFIGTIRSNLDPFDQHADKDLWQVLEDIHMKAAVEISPEKLDAPVTENGENLSVGQRQLMCLGRALLRNSKILLMDEATASVDMETDDLIQKTIREKFRDITVITIAHRINTIMDSDRVMVMEGGRIVEFDTPENLVRDESSIFYSLVQESGKRGIVK